MYSNHINYQFYFSYSLFRFNSELIHWWSAFFGFWVSILWIFNVFFLHFSLYFIIHFHFYLFKKHCNAIHLGQLVYNAGSFSHRISSSEIRLKVHLAKACWTNELFIFRIRYNLIHFLSSLSLYLSFSFTFSLYFSQCYAQFRSRTKRKRPSKLFFFISLSIL